MSSEAVVIVVAVVASFAAGAIALLVMMPFFVSLTRLRANYLPKAVSLNNVLNDGEEEAMERRSFFHSVTMRTRRATAKIGPVVDGVIPMIRRTKRLEGWRGLYQGTTIVATGASVAYVFGFIFSYIMFSKTITSDGDVDTNMPIFWVLAMEVIEAFIVLPFDVVLKRTMVHPRRLNWFAPRESLQEVLSASEYKQPWRLYRLPGLLPVMLLRVALVSSIYAVTNDMLLPSMGLVPIEPADPNQDEYEGPSSVSIKRAVFAFAAYLIILLAVQLIVVPLECMVVRLSTQRPVTQQPLHVAYADNAPAQGPASHNHQATVPETVAPSEAPADAEDAQDAQDADVEAAPKPANAPSASVDDDAELADDDDLPMLSAPAPRRSTLPPRTKSPTSEPVIALRPCDEALDEIDSYYGAAPVERYLTLGDCFRKMVAEEGYESLFRGLPFSMGLMFLGALGMVPALIDVLSLFS